MSEEQKREIDRKIWFEIAGLVDIEKDEEKFIDVIMTALAESRKEGIEEAGDVAVVVIYTCDRISQGPEDEYVLDVTGDRAIRDAIGRLKEQG